jgi:hypothetical protein
VWASPLDIRRRVFCNRSLNMKRITAIGFDMVRQLGTGMHARIAPQSLVPLPARTGGFNCCCLTHIFV